MTSPLADERRGDTGADLHGLTCRLLCVGGTLGFGKKVALGVLFGRGRSSSKLKKEHMLSGPE